VAAQCDSKKKGQGAWLDHPEEEKSESPKKRITTGNGDGKKAATNGHDAGGKKINRFGRWGLKTKNGQKNPEARTTPKSIRGGGEEKQENASRTGATCKRTLGFGDRHGKIKEGGGGSPPQKKTQKKKKKKALHNSTVEITARGGHFERGNITNP